MKPLSNESKEQAYVKHDNVFKQCVRCSSVVTDDCIDILDTNSRADITCYAYDRFKEKGLTLKKLNRFQSEVHQVIYPWNTAYRALSFDVNILFNVIPLIIVMAETEKDVINAFRFALKYKIPIRLRSGGHSVLGYSLVQDGMIIDQSRRRKIILDVKRRRACIESGVLLGPLAQSLFEYKLGFVVGTCVNNGAMGYNLNGGISILSRVYGIGSDNVISLKILLADGRIVKVNKKHYPDLYFALRGAGANQYGIVLSITLNLFSIDKVLYYVLEYPFSAIKTVIKEWIPWIYNSPKTMTSSLRNSAGGGVVRVSGFYLNLSKRELLKELKPLLEIMTPKVSITKVPFIEAIKLSSVARWPLFFYTKNGFITGPLSEEALDIIEKYMAITDPNNTILIDGLGGVIDQIPPTESAFVHRNFYAWFLINARWNNEEEEEEKLAWLEKFYKELSPHLAFQVYQNFPEIIDNHLERYYGENLEKLKDIKKRYDPYNIFRYQQSIPV